MTRYIELKECTMERENNYFQDYVSNKARTMIQASHNINSIHHNGLKGTFREYSLSNFLKDFLPNTYGVGSGLIQDSIGNQSPETDLLIWKKNELPPIIINESKGIYPLESCFCFFEIKSEITATNIKDAVQKSEKLNQLKFLTNYNNPQIRLTKIFFAYKSDSDTIDELKRFHKYSNKPYDEPPYDAICVVGKGFWLFKPGIEHQTLARWAYYHSDAKHYEVIGFLGTLLNTLTESTSAYFGSYILESESSKKAEIIYARDLE